MASTRNKLNKSAIDAGEIEPTQGNVHGKITHLGGCELCYEDINNPDKYSKLTNLPTGSFETVDMSGDKKEIRNCLFVGETRNYTGGGQSCQVDGHQDNNTESTHRINVAGDFGTSNKTLYHTSTEGSVIAHNRYKKEFVVAASDSKSFMGSFGDQVNEHSGNWHEGFKKDHVQAVSGNKITMVDGDYAIHAQKGNYDVHIAQRGRMFSTGPMLIESTTLITLKVGASTIVIGPASIKLTSPRIDLN
jgi:hypothetical protein